MLKPTSGWFTIFLGALIGLTAMSIDITLPSLLRLVEEFQTTPEKTQYTLSAFMFGYAGGQLFWGPVSDRFGRKPVLLVGLVLFTLTSLACSFALSIDQLIATRFIQALGASAGAVLGRAIVRDTFEGTEGGRMLSHMTAIMSFAIVFAPIIGAFLLTLFNWRAIFLFLALVGIILTGVTGFHFPESHRTRTRRGEAWAHFIAGGRGLLTHKGYLLSLVAISLSGTMLFLYVAGSPYLFMTVFGLSSRGYGYMFAIIGIAYGGAAWLNGRLIRRFGLGFLLRQGAILVVGGGVLLMLLSRLAPDSLVGAALALILIEGGVATLVPTVTMVALKPFPHAAGLAAAMIGTAQIGSSGLTASAVSWTFNGRADLLYGSFFVIGTLTAVVIAALIRVTAGSLHPDSSAAERPSRP